MNEIFSKNSSFQYRENVSRLISWGHWFLFFNILLGMLIAIRFIIATPWPTTGLGQFYLLVSWVGHFGFIGFILFLLTIFPLTFICTNQRLLRSLSILIAVAIQTLLLIDTQVYHLLKFHLNPFVWSLLLEPAQSKANLNWNFLFVVIPLLFLLELLISSATWNMALKRKRKKRVIGNIISTTLVSCFLLSHLTYLVADAKLYEPIIAQRSNFPLSYPMTARSFLARHGWLDIEQYNNKAALYATEEHVKSRLSYPLKPLHVVSEENKKMFYVPEGFAHGFLTLDDETEFQYKCTDYYAPEFDAGIIWNDETVGIQWPFEEYGIKEEGLLISGKDQVLPKIEDRKLIENV